MAFCTEAFAQAANAADMYAHMFHPMCVSRFQFPSFAVQTALL